MVVHRAGQRPFGGILPDHVLGEQVVELARLGQRAEDLGGARRVVVCGGPGVHREPLRRHRARGVHVAVACKDVRTERDAFVADENPVGTLHEAAHLVCGLAAERAADVFGAGRVCTPILHRHALYAFAPAAAREVMISSTRP